MRTLADQLELERAARVIALKGGPRRARSSRIGRLRSRAERSQPSPPDSEAGRGRRPILQAPRGGSGPLRPELSWADRSIRSID